MELSSRVTGVLALIAVVLAICIHTQASLISSEQTVDASAKPSSLPNKGHVDFQSNKDRQIPEFAGQPAILTSNQFATPYPTSSGNASSRGGHIRHGAPVLPQYSQIHSDDAMFERALSSLSPQDRAILRQAWSRMNAPERHAFFDDAR